MNKYLYAYLFLALLLLYFFISRYLFINFKEGYRNSHVYIGESPISRNSLLFLDNNDTFGWHSIYETGKIKYPEDIFINSENSVYGLPLNNAYGSSYKNYYNYL
jgi:hypothetical protein